MTENDKAGGESIAQNKTETDATKVVIVEPQEAIHADNVTAEQPSQQGRTGKLINDFMPDNVSSRIVIQFHV